ncbi:hypothetical protein H5410_015237 [Solanum commersonii]|uniref:Uncharacterized protein n=1 Tax=Solanum commersonii TaxID=4109 RepID=A0A9J5ZT01_SOLCO|nr:hypothetical protein H5410_015237 [Solanum commersonii]
MNGIFNTSSMYNTIKVITRDYRLGTIYTRLGSILAQPVLLEWKWIPIHISSLNALKLSSSWITLFLRLRMAAIMCISTIQIDIDSSDIIDIIYKGHDSFTTTIFECRELLQKLGNP